MEKPAFNVGFHLFRIYFGYFERLQTSSRHQASFYSSLFLVRTQLTHRNVEECNLITRGQMTSHLETRGLTMT